MLDIPLNGWESKFPEKSATENPQLLPMTCYVEDVERNRKAGYYDAETNYIPYNYGYYENRQIDVSNIECHLERAEVTDLGFVFRIHVQMPEEWDAMTRYMAGESLQIQVLLDGETAKDGKATPFYFFIGGEERCTLDKETGEYYWPVSYYTTANQSNHFVPSMLKAEKITFCLNWVYATELTMGETVYDLTSGERIEIVNFPLTNKEIITLKTITISTEELNLTGEIK